MLNEGQRCRFKSEACRTAGLPGRKIPKGSVSGRTFSEGTFPELDHFTEITRKRIFLIAAPGKVS